MQDYLAFAKQAKLGNGVSGHPAVVDMMHSKTMQVSMPELRKVRAAARSEIV